MRICSLLPSATEIVFALGLQDQLVAVTHECDFPDEAGELPAITGSRFDHQSAGSRPIHDHISESVHSGSSIYDLNLELLRKLAPDLILTQELCDVCAVSYRTVRDSVRVLEGDCQIVSLEPTGLDAILETIRTVAELGGVPGRAARLIQALRQRIRSVEERTRNTQRRPLVFAVEWLDPLFAGGHWVPEMIERAGGRDLLGIPGSPSRIVTAQEAALAEPEIVVLMPCGFNLSRTIAEFEQEPLTGFRRLMAAGSSVEVFAVDGSSYFNRPGPRVVDGIEILAEILHPELFPRKRPAADWKKVEPFGGTGT